MRRHGRRAAALALPRPVLPGIAGDLRGRPRRGLRQGRHPQAVPRFLRRHRPADRRRDRPQRPVREAGQEPARLLHRHRPRRRRARAGQHRAQRVLDGHDAARAGPFGLQQQEHPAEPSLCAADRGAHPDDRGRGHDVRAVLARTPTGCKAMGVHVPDPPAFDRGRRQDAPRPSC